MLRRFLFLDRVTFILSKIVLFIEILFVIEFQLNLQKISNNKNERILNKKLSNLKYTQQIHNFIQLNKHKDNLNNVCHDNKEFKDPWIVNCIDAHIPDNVNDVLK